MEDVAARNGIGTAKQRNKEGVVHPSRRKIVPAVERLPPVDMGAKMAAIAMELNVRLRSADMPAAMQERAFRLARALMDAASNSPRPNPTPMALALKKEFDASYGPAWHCAVGKSFGSFVTHSRGGFLYFSIDKFCFLLFKTEVRRVTGPPPLRVCDLKK
ncbi:PREDICTED: dynein light chain, cytoplasmic-like [Nelumbo nucifera]|uniref:Dynein light chain n=2 Tax=Nelumbo nucifera TaxID=4432 RepID=A0A822ZY29_NELNU|nr:PREDICTED: dynein light chain, cytoplasmic-like [Nelumbo nucifera]DAD47746.1 TPA_asm: hypothetical protein HUJ06_017683 [Nelumbo nucifera]